MNKVRVGPITMALGLIITGTVLLAGNFINQEILLNAWKLWPFLLVGLGLEFLIRDAMGKRAKEPVEIRFSWVSVVIIGLIVFSGFTAHVTYKIAGAVNIEQLIREQVLNDAVTYTRPFEKEPIAVSSQNIKLKFENSRGDINVRASSDDNIHIKGEIVAGGPGEKEAREKAEKANVEVQGTDFILVKADLPGYQEQNQVTVNYEILVPKGLYIEIQNKSGEVSVEDVEGQVKIFSKVGELRVSDVSGNVELRSDVGEITVERVTGDMRADSKTGSVHVNDPGAGVVARTKTGSIEFSATKPLQGGYDLNTTNGSIDIMIPEQSDLTVNALTDHGSVTGPDSILVEHRDRMSNKLEGNLGKGSGELKAYSRTGSINLNLR